MGVAEGVMGAGGPGAGVELVAEPKSHKIFAVRPEASLMPIIF